MFDLHSLPVDFSALAASPPSTYRLSHRVIDPAVLIDRNGARLTARLAGRRRAKGQLQTIVAPTNHHSWVLDGETIRPLPYDAPAEFQKILQENDPENLPYTVASSLLRSGKGLMEVEVTEGVLASGAKLASRLPSAFEIGGLDATLYPYQARGVQWMWDTVSSTGGLILADEMGLGKTLQIIALLMIQPPMPEAPALIVCPTSLIANWVREIRRFAPTLSLAIHRGPLRTGVYRGLQKTSLVITTYDTLVNDIAIFSAFEWSWVICDEAQAIKNPDSNRRRCLAEIPRARTIPMTGTPVENSLIDLWSLADIAVPGMLGTRSEFEEDFPDSVETASRLGELADPIILKRRVSDVASDLPERIDIDLPIKMEDALVEHYRSVREETLEKYPVAGALVATLQLQLVCAHPWLREQRECPEDGENAVIVEDPNLPLVTNKMERILDLLREAFLGGRKVLIFAVFNRVGDLIKRAGHDLPAAFWGAINGSTPQADRQTIIDEFSRHAGPACLILNPKAAGAGLNITAATVVIHLSPVWNPALEAQASARAHRRGQTMPVTVYRLFYEDTVERVMLDRSAWKNKLGNEIAPVTTRNADDLNRALEIQPKLT